MRTAVSCKQSLISLMLLLLASLALTACAGASLANVPSGVPVLQISGPATGQVLLSAHPTTRVPLVTLWADGRVVFVLPEEQGDPDGLVRAVRLDADAVDQLMREAAFLHNLDDSYSAFMVLGYAVPATFGIQTSDGRKTVVAQFLSLKPGPWEAGQHAETMDRLRALYHTVLDALPEDAPPMRPNEVSVAMDPFDRLGPQRAENDWPVELTGHLEGKAAHEAAALLPPGPVRPFLTAEGVRNVAVVPVIPLLHAGWPLDRAHGGIPAYPSLTAHHLYTSLRDFPEVQYRLVGAEREEVAAWHRDVMSAAGWRLAKDEEDLLVWARSAEDRRSLVQVRFSTPDRFTVDLLDNHGGIPRHPDGVLGACEERGCQAVSDAAVEEVRAWFDEHLAYVGWESTGDGGFIRDRETGDGHYHLTIDYRQEDDAVVVVPHEEFVMPSWWPTPTPTPVPPDTLDASAAHFVLHVEPLDETGFLVRLVAEVVGGPDNNRELYCSDIRWDFGDGTVRRAVPGCPVWSPHVEIGRRSERVHRY
ncbi:MAG: hypothetical protein WD533_07500, partial [Dehalococcoidia bacterium]